MKHICYLTGKYNRYDSLMFIRQGRSLAKQGYAVSYVVSDNCRDETKEGVKIISIGTKKYGRLENFFGLKRQIYRKAIEVDADIYQISELELLPVGIKLKTRGKRVVFNIRENYLTQILDKDYIPRRFRKLISLITEFLMKRYLPQYDAIFAVTPERTEEAKDRFGVEKSYLLANFPDVDLNYSLSFEDYTKRRDVLLYFGTIYKISYQEFIFDALKTLPNVQYLLAGKTDDNYLSFLKNHSYWDKTEFINGFSKDELSSILSRATMSNVLRDFDRMGIPNGSLGIIKMFESMEAALPVICSDVKINREIVEKYNCGICVDPKNIQQIHVAIKYLAENKAEAYRMGQNGRRAIIEEFNWKKQFEIYINVLNSL